MARVDAIAAFRGFVVEAASMTFYRPANASELAILNHPDRDTSWTGVAVCHMAGEASGAKLKELVESRIPDLARLVPMSAVRLRGYSWHHADPPAPELSHDDDPTPARMLAPFDLESEPPLKVLVDARGRWVSLFVHHAAFDGPLLIDAARVLLCGLPPQGSRPEPTGRARFPWNTLRRLVRPADPVARSSEPPQSDTFLSRPLPPVGRGVGTKLPAACLEAVSRHNARQKAPLRRVGITIGISKVRGQANLSTYRRVDLVAGQPVEPAIRKVLDEDVDPWEIRHPTRLIRILAPLLPRLSDTILFTDVGRLVMPGLRRVEGYPVARGRSAVAFCALRMAGGESTLTLRCRYLDRADAEALIDEAISCLDARLSPLRSRPRSAG